MVQVISGYTGGTKENPAYEGVSSGSTGHRESIEVIYDPSKIIECCPWSTHPKKALHVIACCGIREAMRWRYRGWSRRAPRLKVAKPSRKALERLQGQVVKFVEESSVLRELLEDVQLARGRLYFRRDAENLMARITPLGPRPVQLEAPHRNSWTERRRGQLATVLKVLEGDTEGTFHGLGSLTKTHRGSSPAAQVVLHRELGIPLRVLTEPKVLVLDASQAGHCRDQ